MKMASVDKVQFASFNDKETIFLAELFLCRLSSNIIFVTRLKKATLLLRKKKKGY